MTKVYTAIEIRPNYTLDELKRGKFMEIKSAMLYEKASDNKDIFILGLQRYPRKGQVHLTKYFTFLGDIGNKFMKEGVGVDRVDELLGKVIMGIVNKKEPFLDGLCGWD
jgi:hypothetical protein